ncbi:MAG: hypothetical protein R6V58_13925, partial [Planctomycetota bacterium]
MSVEIEMRKPETVGTDRTRWQTKRLIVTACVLAILSSMPAGAGVVTVPTDYGDGADAFARAGSYANENYGTGNGLTVKGSPNPDYALISGFQ